MEESRDRPARPWTAGLGPDGRERFQRPRVVPRPSDFPKLPPSTPHAGLVSTSGASVATKFATGAGEDHLRACSGARPIDRRALGIRAVPLAGEDHLAEMIRVRPDHAVHVGASQASSRVPGDA